MLNKIRPYLTSKFLSEERLISLRDKEERRRLKHHEPHHLIAYLAINDPSSYLLLQVLPEIKKRFKVTITYKIVLAKQPIMFPEPSMWDANALKDCIKIAELYDLTRPQAPTLNKNLTKQASIQLAAIAHYESFPVRARSIYDAYWSNNTERLTHLFEETTGEEVDRLSENIRNNEQDLLNRKHYLSGTIYYGKEWYWGLERLQYLEERLNDLGLSELPTIKYDRLHQHLLPFNRELSTNNKLTIYFSIRSPYSYLGLNRASAISKHFNLKLEIKPVLPMMMRNMFVPKNKGMYIAFDTKRESLKYDIPFGKIADPLGKGVEHCYALFEYAKQQEKEQTFLLNYASCVWSEGVLSETEKGLKHIVEKSGLDWNHAKALLQDTSWRQWANNNLEEMYSLGLWGVPSFKYCDTSVFGQDKLLFIEKAILQSLTKN